MNDKYDDAVILIRPIVKLESEMDIEQLQIRMGEMAAEVERLTTENARLQSVIDAANAQEPAIVVKGRKVVGFNPAEGTRIEGEFYARPIPAQQSPENIWLGALLEAAKKLVESDSQNTGAEPSVSIYYRDAEEFLSVANDFPKYGHMQQSPAVEVPDWYVVDRTDCDPKVFKREDDAIHFALASKTVIVAKETRVYPVFIGLPSPRITEQEFREIGLSSLRYWIKTPNANVDDWLENDGTFALLTKLNEANHAR